LADMRAVRLRRVDEVHAELDGAAEHRQRFGAVARRTPDAFAGDPHRAETEAANIEVAAEGEGVSHCGESAAERDRLQARRIPPRQRPSHPSTDSRRDA